MVNINTDYNVRFPDTKDLSQGEEFFYVQLNGEEKKMKLHDYEDLYKHPFLYEAILYDLLKCSTPQAICNLLKKALQENEVQAKDLRVLEMGAGSGIFGEALKNMGVGYVAGLDIYEIAKEAAYRDRPSLYDKYYIEDLTQPSEDAVKDIEASKFNCVAVASATGWGNHIPVKGFDNAFNVLEDGGWFVYHVKRDAEDQECIDLCAWIDDKIESKIFEVKAQDSCFHRNSIQNVPIYYDVIIGTKNSQ